MSTLPLSEAILLEIHQSLGGDGYPTIRKNKFASGQAGLAAHKAMGVKVLHSIFDALDMDPLARLDALDNFMEFGNAYKYLELNIWTFAADQRQIIWMLLGHFYVPGLARRVGFWSIAQVLDKGMPGGRFWYLPELCEMNGKTSLHLPVAQVVDWLLDLLGMPLEEFADQRSESTDGGHDGLRRSLYNWRNATSIRPDTIQKYFPDNKALDFKGVFSVDKNRAAVEQFDDALDFVRRKKLSADQLRLEIPMTQAGRLEAILDGSTDADEKAEFVGCLAERYAAPSPKTIRQRLLLARTVQDGYIRLLNFLSPGVDRQCTDPQQNKSLQLFAIYKLVYNLTIAAKRNCGNLGEAAENAWFEKHLPDWDKSGLYLCILPSRQESANLNLSLLLTRNFFDVQEGAELVDHVGLDTHSALPIIKRNAERMATFANELCTELHLVERMKKSSSWRALQSENSYWVISQVAQHKDLSPRAKEAATQRLRDLAVSPAQAVQAILLELDGYLNGERKQRPKDTLSKVQALIDEAEASAGYELWRAAVLQYKAKHLLACNDFDGAGKLFRMALEAVYERNYGTLRGEVARDCLAIEVANQKLIKNNHEKYYREMLAGGMMAECETPPSIEETARWASEYFWDTLYKPYPSVTTESRRSSEVGRKIIEVLMPLFFSGDQEGMRAWIKNNNSLLKSSLPDVDGNSILMLLIKMHTTFAQGLHKLPTATLGGEQKNFEAMLENWWQFFGLLAQQAPRQLNITDFKGQTPLMLMAEAGDSTLVGIMLQGGANPELQDYQGMTALHSSIKSRADSCVNALLDHPCSLDKLTYDGQSPLHTASWTANLHAVSRLLKLAPELAWQRNSHGVTPLEQVEFLIENPEALQGLTNRRAQDGKNCASQQALVIIAQLLEQAISPPIA